MLYHHRWLFDAVPSQAKFDKAEGDCSTGWEPELKRCSQPLFFYKMRELPEDRVGGTVKLPRVMSGRCFIKKYTCSVMLDELKAEGSSWVILVVTTTAKVVGLLHFG